MPIEQLRERARREGMRTNNRALDRVCTAPLYETPSVGGDLRFYVCLACGHMSAGKVAT